MRKFIIVGGGISGLSTAMHILKRFPSSNITLFEQNKHIGGSIKTTNVNGFLCEEGPRSIRNTKYSAQLNQIITEVGLKDKIVPSETLPYTYIYWNGKLRHIPQKISLESLLKFKEDNQDSIMPLMNTIRQYIKKSKELNLKIKSKDMSIYDYLSQINDDDANVNLKFAETIFYGIYGTSIRNISVQLALFKEHLKYFKLGIVPKDQMPKYKSYRFTEGLQMLPNAINDHLKKTSQYDLKLNSSFDEIDLDKKEIIFHSERIHFDNLILTIPTHQLKIAIRKITTKNPDKQLVLDQINEIIQNIKTSGLLSRNLCFNKTFLPKNFKGFGYLINPNQKQKLVGMVNDSMLFPTMKPIQGDCISLMALPENQAPIFHLEVRKSIDPDFICESNWLHHFPIYEPGHMERGLKLISLFEQLQSGLQIGGSTLFAAAIPELVMQSKFLVEKL